ncbi:MAG TPA: hypothetical protein VFE32_02525 [Puia sp.]|jgi:hypothetical protein|nr:hypothetical protein [Puia sp.]
MKLIPLISVVTVFAALLGTGCMKSSVSPSFVDIKTSTATSTDSNKIVYTPFGPRYASDVIALTKGAHLRYDGDILLEVDNKSGAVLRNLGKQEPLSYVRELTAKISPITSLSTKPAKGPVPQPTNGQGWVTYGELPEQNPVTFFSTNWKVPAAPTSSGGLFYVFNGLQDGLTRTSHILQPVLQYGVGGDGGGNYWAVNNWYASCQTCTAITGAPSPTAVSVGTALTGVIQQTGQAGGNYSYSSSFTQYPGVSLVVQNVPALTFPFETMEVYNMTGLSTYPPVNDIPMTAINLQAGGVNPALAWAGVDASTEEGQHTVVVSDANPGGEVDLYITNPIGGTGNYLFTTNNQTGGGTITGIPGQWVPVQVQAIGHPGQTYTLAVRLSGANFYYAGSGYIFAANSTVVDGFYLPASGSVTWSSVYTQTFTGGHGDFIVN